MGGELQIRVTLIVPEQNIKTWVQRFDQVVFEQQGLCLATHHGGFHPHNLGHHVANARTTMVFLKVIGNTLFQVARLTDVKHAAFSIKVAVNTWQGWQCGDFFKQFGRKFKIFGHAVLWTICS